MGSTAGNLLPGRGIALAAVAVLVLACTDSGGSDVRSPAPTGSIAAPASAPESSAVSPSTSSGGGYTRGDYGNESSPAPAASGTGADVVNVATGAVGSYLTGADGRTLYTFKPDGPSKSACGDGCAQTWPPFTVGTSDSPTAGSGVTGTLTTFARDDGSTQVAYNGAPLYYFANDSAPGDTKGQGIGGNWFVAAP